MIMYVFLLPLLALVMEHAYITIHVCLIRTLQHSYSTSVATDAHNIPDACVQVLPIGLLS